MLQSLKGANGVCVAVSGALVALNGIVLLVITGVILGAAAPAGQPGEARTLVANEIQIHDKAGRVRMQLSVVDEQPQLRIMSADGRVAALMGLNDGVPTLLLADESRIGISAGQEQAQVNLYRPRTAIDAPSASLATDQDSTELSLRTEVRDQGITLALTPFGQALTMSAGGFQPEVFLSATPEGGVFGLFDKDHKPIVSQGPKAPK